MTLRLTGRKRPAHEGPGARQPPKRLKMREVREVRVQLSVVAGTAGAAVALQLSCCRQVRTCRTPTGPLGMVGARASHATVAVGGADLQEVETEEEDEDEEEEEEREAEKAVRRRSKVLTLTLMRDEGDGSLGFALAGNNQVTAVHAGGLAASAGLQVDDRIIEVNAKDTGVEPFASLLPKDETLPVRLKIVRMLETQTAAPAAVDTHCVATFSCPGCGAALRFEFETGALVEATMCTECSTPLRVRLPPRRPFLALPAPAAIAATASSAPAPAPAAATAVSSPTAAATTSTVALPSPPPLDNSFIERVVFYRFPFEGWQRGVAVEQCVPGAEKDDDGDECNFLIYYEADDTEVPTCLAATDYDSREDAPSGSWYVVPGSMGGGGGFGGGGGGFDSGGGGGGSPSGQDSRDGTVTTKKIHSAGGTKMLDKCLNRLEVKCSVAPPHSASTAPTSTKRAFTSPWNEFAQAQRLLLPKGLSNGEREKRIGEMWSALSDAGRLARSGATHQAAAFVPGLDDLDDLLPSTEEEQAAAPPRAASPSAQTSQAHTDRLYSANFIARLATMELGAEKQRPKRLATMELGAEKQRLKRPKYPKFKRPSGGNPKGKLWNYETGNWENEATASGSAVVEAEGAAEEAAEESLGGGGDTGSKEKVEVVELQAVELQAVELQAVEPDVGDVEEVELVQQKAQQEALAQQQEAQAAQVVDVTSSVPPLQPEKKQVIACELVLIPLGDDAREEVGTE